MSWEVDIRMAPSGIHGIGVISEQFVPKGTVVWRFSSEMKLCSARMLRQYDQVTRFRALLGGYLHEPSDQFVWYDDGMQFVNHGDGARANIGTPSWARLEEDCCVALADILPGEELLEDYAFWSIFNLPRCHWLRAMYREHCRSHYDFMRKLARVPSDEADVDAQAFAEAAA